MPIIKTQFKESSAKRNEIDAKNVKLGKFKNDITVVDVKELPQGETAAVKGVIFEFKFHTDYALEEPKGKSLGEIVLVGEVIFVEKTETIDKIVKSWKKDKKLEAAVIKPILNVAFEHAQIEALGQAKKVGLPLPVPLMRFKK